MRVSARPIFLSLLTIMLMCGLWAQPAAAQVRAGVRGGLSIDPDQVFVGGHIETAPLIDRVRFRPNVEVGFGDDVTLTAFNFEFVYAFPSRGPWHVYAGGGPSVNFFRVGGHNNTDGGFNLLVGAENSRGLFFEGKIGVASGANAKFAVGYTFR
jgi:hypothetical protein